MNEVEMMYKNAGIKPLPICNNCNMLDEYWSNGTYYGTCKCDKDNDECNMANYIYTPLTAEKQLEIVKMILFSTWWMNLKRLQFSEKFDEGLAQMINDLWQDLTEEEKQQVKGIILE